MKKIMKKISKVVAATLAAVLCLTACGGQAVEEAESAPETVQGESAESTEATPYWEMLDQVSDTSELPDWTGETLEVTVWQAGGTAGMMDAIIADTDVAYKEFERVTGVKFNIEESFDNGGNNIDAKLPMVVASEDFPTIMMGYGVQKQFDELQANGYFEDLTSYYESGALDQVTKWYPQEGAYESMVWDGARDDNGSYFLIPTGDDNSAKVYTAAGDSVPEEFDSEYYASYGQSPSTFTWIASNRAIFVRDDILKEIYPDALTMDEIKQIYMENGEFTEEQIFDTGIDSREEFMEFLYKVKELVDNGDYVGIDGKPIEVTFGPNTETDNWRWGVYLPALLDGLSSDSDYFSALDRTAEDESQLIQWSYDTEYYVEFMKDLNELVNADIIAQDSLLDNAATFNEKLTNGHYAVPYCYDLPEGGEGWSYRPVWIKQAVNEEIGSYDAAPTFNYYFGIFKDVLTDEQLDQLIHAVNYLNSVVGINNFYWGPETAGLFTEDADGNRSYVDPELHDCMVNNVDNGAAAKYGLTNVNVAEAAYKERPQGIGNVLLKPSYLAAATKDRVETDALKFYNPGTLSPEEEGGERTYVNTVPKVYGIGAAIDGCAEFWSARAGFENQMKKVIVAESEAEFEKQLEELKLYGEENGLTEETRQQLNDLYVEQNRERLQEIGIIK